MFSTFPSPDNLAIVLDLIDPEATIKTRAVEEEKQRTDEPNLPDFTISRKRPATCEA